MKKAVHLRWNHSRHVSRLLIVGLLSQRPENHSGKPSTTSKAGGMKTPLLGLMLAPPLSAVSLTLLTLLLLVLERPRSSFFNHWCIFLLCNIFSLLRFRIRFLWSLHNILLPRTIYPFPIIPDAYHAESLPSFPSGIPWTLILTSLAVFPEIGAHDQGITLLLHLYSLIFACLHNAFFHIISQLPIYYLSTPFRDKNYMKVALVFSMW